MVANRAEMGAAPGEEVAAPRFKTPEGPGHDLSREEHRMWKKEKLHTEMTYEEFLKELEDLKAWINKNPRMFGAWLYAVRSWAEGDH